MIRHHCIVHRVFFLSFVGALLSPCTSPQAAVRGVCLCGCFDPCLEETLGVNSCYSLSLSLLLTTAEETTPLEHRPRELVTGSSPLLPYLLLLLPIIAVTYAAMSTSLKKNSHLSALRYGDRDLGPVVGSRGHVFNLPHDKKPVDDPAEDDVLPVQEVTLCARDEELAPVGVLARVGHGEEPRRVVPQLEVLVLKGAATVDGGHSRAVIVYEVAT